MILKQSTAATVVVGPVLDSAGAAVTTAVTANFSLSKNGTVNALTTETVTHSTNGYYTIALTTSNTDTLGRIEIIVNDSAMSMSTHRYNVIVGTSYDLLVTSGGYSTLDASGIRSAVGLASANLDTQLSTIDTVVDAIEVDTQDIQSRLPAALVSGRMSSYADTLSEGFGDNLSGYIADDIASGNWDWPTAVGVIADAVLEESILDHRNVNHSLAKFIWQIRQANLTIDGVVSTAITPTTLTFSSNVSATTSAYAHAVLLFVSGPLTGENSPIISYNNTNGVFVLEEPLTAAPSDGDEFVVISGSHVHSIADIQNGLATSAELAVVDAIADKLDTTLELDGGVYRFTANALEETPTGGGGSGTGSFTINLVVKLTNGNTVGDCDVSLTTSATSSTTNLIASARTNPNGEVTFQLDSGVFYVWRQKLGVNFDNPVVLTVAGDGSATVS